MELPPELREAGLKQAEKALVAAVDCETDLSKSRYR
jgi:hypothetical protein